MRLKTFYFLSSLLFAFTTNAFAQYDSSEGSGSDDDWVSTESSQPSSTSNASYDGSADSEFANDEEYASAYARYKNQTTSRSEISRQRSEGFARSVYLGIRAQGGTNTFFGKNSNGWGLGWQAGGGLMIKMALPVKNLSLTPELTFNYRHYNYEKDMEAYTNEAFINIMLFEFPIMFRYTLEDMNMFIGFGINLGLGFMGKSELTTTPNSNAKGSGITTKQNNPIKTSSMEVGGAIDLGYMLTRYVHINIRFVQSFTNLLNKTLTVPPFDNSNLMTFSATAGISYLF